MEYLIYISTSTKLLSEQELTEILTVSRDNNVRDNITGVLLYAEGTFIQLIEGPPDKLKATYDKIFNDDRHKNVIKLNQCKIDMLNFPDWSMGFRRIDNGQLNTLKGYFKPGTKDFNTDEQHQGIAMIKAFAESNLMI